MRWLTADNHLHFRFIAALRAGDPEGTRRDAEGREWSNELITRHEELGRKSRAGRSSLIDRFEP